MSILGIDIGTSGCKAIVVSNDGKLLYNESSSYSTLNVGNEFYEINPEEVWQKVKTCIQKCNQKTTVDPVSALAISAQGEAVVPLDKNGRALSNAPISSDMRGRIYLDTLREKLGSKHVFELTGQLIDPIHTLFKLMWWKDHEKDLLRNAWKYVCFDGYIYSQMSLPPVTDETLASRTMLFDINKKYWSDELLGLVGLEEKNLPEVVSSGSIIGRLAHDVSSALGFAMAPIVISGSHDQPCAALGSGVYLDGASYSIGTTECIALISRQRIDTFDVFAPTYPHCYAGSFVSLLGSQTGARLFTWMNDIIYEGHGPDENDQRDRLYEYIRSVIPSYRTEIIFIPHLAGSGMYYRNPNAKGIIYGLTLQTHREDFLKAALEGITFEQNLAFSDLLKCSKRNKEDMPLRAIGGGALWIIGFR